MNNNTLWLNPIAEHADERLKTLPYAQRRRLDHEVGPKLIDDETAQSICFAIDPPKRTHSGFEPNVVAQITGSQDLAFPPSTVNRQVSLPTVEPNSDAALRVKDPGGNVIAVLGNEVDDGAAIDSRRDSIDSRFKNPGVSTEKRRRFSRLQSNLRWQNEFLDGLLGSIACSDLIRNRKDYQPIEAERLETELLENCVTAKDRRGLQLDHGRFGNHNGL